MLENEDKRLIEMKLPLEEIGDDCEDEQNKSYGRLSNMHKWWAYRPLTASRVAAFASLVPYNENKKDEDFNFLTNLSKWDNKHNIDFLEKAKKRIKDYNDGDPPKILDPFSGSGSMPLEAKRIGCEAHALEYNPIAYLINLGVLSFPDLVEENNEDGWSDNRIENSEFLKDLKKWSDWILEKSKKELVDIYGDDELHYIWARTIPCQNPECDLDIPLIRTFWLANKDNHKVIYDINCDTDGNIDVSIYREKDFEIIKENNKRKVKLKENGEVINPSEPTVRRGSVSCPACGSSYKGDTTRELSKKVGFDNKLMVIVEKKEGVGKKYRLPTSKDYERIKKAEDKLNELDNEFIPQEKIPEHEKTSKYLNPRNYEYDKWKKLFNTRQLLALGTFAKNINKSYEKILEEKQEGYAKAITTYLAFALDKVADYNSTLVAWGKESRSKNTFTRSALPIKWDYVEGNVLGEGNSGSWKAAMDLLPRAIKTCSGTLGSSEVHLGDAADLPFSNREFDAVLTDPPYYNYIPYAALSDYFYVWLKRTIGDLYPKAFSTPLTPKSGEIIQDKGQHKDKKESPEEFFEEKLTQAFSEINRVLKDEGITTIVFAHKSTEAWAQMIRSLLASDLVVTATWPLHTEKRNRVRSMGSASLASSVYFVCRKKPSHETGYYSEVEEELNEELKNRLDYFWESGIRGADLLVSAIGPAVETFGKYDEVKRLSGEEVPVSEWIEKTQRIVSDYALSKVLEGDVELGAIDHETRFYILYRWAFANEKEDFDEVKKLAQINDVNLDLLENLGIIETKRGDVKVIPPHKRNIDEPSKIPESNDLPLIEKIHRASILWKREERDKLKVFIEQYCPQEKFWRSVQAIAEALPSLEEGSDDDKKEKQMLHGLGNYAGQVEFEERLQTSIDEYGGE